VTNPGNFPDGRVGANGTRERPVRESTGTDKVTEARRILREHLGDLAAGRLLVPHADRVRFEELAGDFLLGDVLGDVAKYDSVGGR